MLKTMKVDIITVAEFNTKKVPEIITYYCKTITVINRYIDNVLKRYNNYIRKLKKIDELIQ